MTKIRIVRDMLEDSLFIDPRQSGHLNDSGTSSRCSRPDRSPKSRNIGRHTRRMGLIGRVSQQDKFVPNRPRLV